MVHQKHMNKGISTVIAIILLIILAVATSIVIYTWRAQRFNGFILSGYPTNVYSGEVFGVTVTAVDQYGSPFTSYTGQTYLSSTDTNMVVPEPGTKSNPYKFIGSDKGVHTFNELRLISVGSYKIIVADGTKSETSNPITVKPEPILDHFEFSPISSPQTAGVDFGITVTAVDQYGNTLTSYSGTPTLTCSAGPISPTTVTSFSSGVGTATVRATTANTGSTITATDAMITGISDPFNVKPAEASALKVNAPGTTTAGTAFTVTVTAIDQYGNTATDYAGTVYFTSNDGAATLPGDYTFVANNQGIHTLIEGVTLNTVKTWSLTVTDKVTPSITGSQTGITVYAKLPSYIGYGDGDSVYPVGNLKPDFPFDLQANDLILLRVLVGDTLATPVTPAGFTLLYGPDQTGTTRHWIYYKFAVGTETGSLTIIIGGSSMKSAQMFAFRGVALTDWTDPAGYGSGNSNTIVAQSVTTTGSNQLALSCIIISDYFGGNIVAFTGGSGGDWIWLGELGFSSTTTSNTLFWCWQIAKMESAGTISGGSITLPASYSWSVRAFTLKP